MNNGTARITVPSIRKFKEEGRKITALTAYDFTFARLVDQCDVDMILVGDSVGMVMQGTTTTIPVTLDQVIYHCRCVAPAVQRSLLVGDLPFGSYQISIEDAVRSGVRLMKEGSVAAVKLEGGMRTAAAIEALVSADIPVLAHVGMTPQSYHRMGGYKVQGKQTKRDTTRDSATQVIEDARAVEEAGAFAVVLECVPMELAAQITEMVSIPTIGIGAGPSCDGQILVLQDMLGMTDTRFTFVRRFADLSGAVHDAVEQYARDVREGGFPAKNESFSSGS